IARPGRRLKYPRRVRLLWLALLWGCGFDRVGLVADLGGDSGSATNCRTLPLPCLAAGSGIIDVTSAGDVQTAFSTAQSGDTIQSRGLSPGAGLRVPSGVTLHGCMGAQITDPIAFAP